MSGQQRNGYSSDVVLTDSRRGEYSPSPLRTARPPSSKPEEHFRVTLVSIGKRKLQSCKQRDECEWKRDIGILVNAAETRPRENSDLFPLAQIKLLRTRAQSAFRLSAHPAASIRRPSLLTLMAALKSLPCSVLQEGHLHCRSDRRDYDFVSHQEL
jgi:hypothetical protein